MPCQISVIYCSNFNHIFFLHTMCHFWILIRTFIRNTIVEKNNNYMKHCFCSKKKISFAIHIINVKSLKKDNKSVSYSLIMVNRQLLCSSFLCSQIRFTSHYKTLPFEVLEKNRGKRKQSIHSYNKNKPQQETRGND